MLNTWHQHCFTVLFHDDRRHTATAWRLSNGDGIHRAYSKVFEAPNSSINPSPHSRTTLNLSSHTNSQSCQYHQTHSSDTLRPLTHHALRCSRRLPGCWCCRRPRLSLSTTIRQCDCEWPLLSTAVLLAAVELCLLVLQTTALQPAAAHLQARHGVILAVLYRWHPWGLRLLACHLRLLCTPALHPRLGDRKSCNIPTSMPR